MTDTGSGPFYDPPAATDPVVQVATLALAWEAWPYHDLVLKQPTCPNCGVRAHMLVGGNVHPVAFCPNDDCTSLSWDPSKSAVDVLWHLVEEAGKNELRPPSD